MKGILYGMERGGKVVPTVSQGRVKMSALILSYVMCVYYYFHTDKYYMWGLFPRHQTPLHDRQRGLSKTGD